MLSVQLPWEYYIFGERKKKSLAIYSILEEKKNQCGTNIAQVVGYNKHSADKIGEKQMFEKTNFVGSTKIEKAADKNGNLFCISTNNEL